MRAPATYRVYVPHPTAAGRLLQRQRVVRSGAALATALTAAAALPRAEAGSPVLPAYRPAGSGLLAEVLAYFLGVDLMEALAFMLAI